MLFLFHLILRTKTTIHKDTAHFQQDKDLAQRIIITFAYCTNNGQAIFPQDTNRSGNKEEENEEGDDVCSILDNLGSTITLC